MRFYKIQNEINDIMSFFYRFGFWHQVPVASPRAVAMKLFYCILHAQFAIALICGAITNDSLGGSIFLVQTSIIVMVLLVKSCFMMWKQNEILDFLNGICTFRIRCDEDFHRANVKMRFFLKFIKLAVLLALLATVIECLVIPVLSQEKYLFYQVAFPWDWRTNDAAYWAALVFVLIGILMLVVAVLMSIIIWYLLLNCSLWYEVLGGELRRIGYGCDGKAGAKLSVQEKENIFSQDLKESINNHVQIRKWIDQLESFCFNLFLLQFCTSGLCICISIYCLTFDVSSNTMERVCHAFTLSYNISDIFMIMFLGNEILVLSDRLSYSLFESNFVDQTESNKKLIIIYAEQLKQPHQLMIGNLYPLTLETFTRVLNGAYSMFNILQNGVQ